MARTDLSSIGNTVTLQYSSGVHKISSWAQITNAHSLPGPGIISGLRSVGEPLGNGLLLLAEMSSADNLLNNQYASDTVKMARKAGREWVIGFIAMSRVEDKVLGDNDKEVDEEEDWLILTPGVGLSSKGDKLGQQYRTPREVVYESGCDVIIVGRGIYGVKGEEEETAERYRAEGWKAYEERLERR